MSAEKPRNSHPEGDKDHSEHAHGPGRGHDHEHAGHVHGPACEHDHDHAAEHAHGPACEHDHEHAGHVHGPACAHEHAPEKRQPRAVANRPAETGGNACQLELGDVIPGETDEFGRSQKLEHLLEARVGITEVHLRRDQGYPELCIHYDDGQVTLTQVLALVRSAGTEVSGRYRQKTWFVRGMDSAQCGYVIEHVLGRTKGVLTANVAYAAERLVIEYDTEVVSLREIESRIGALTYELEDPEHGHACSHHSHSSGLAPRLEMPLVLASGGLIAAGLAARAFVPAAPLAQNLLFALALGCGGFFPVRDAWTSVRRGLFDIETLMVVAAVGACFLGAWFEGAFLLFLFSLGHALEHRAMERARRAIEALARLRPEIARVKRGGEVKEVPVSEVLRGDIVLVRPGDRVPVDGVIRAGHSSLDQATITGESVPVAKGPGGGVFASTVNLDGVLEIEATKRSTESVLARIIDMVTEAEAQKSPTQRFAKRLERRFVPLVLVAAPALTVALLVLGNGLTEAVLRGISLLVAASPCALAISTPAAVLSAVARAARGGVLIKGGANLETLGKVGAVAFDKTGTLTVGKPRVVGVAPADGIPEHDLVSTAACSEVNSSHPIAHAILEAARIRGIQPAAADNCVAVHGKGVRAFYRGEPVAVGSPALFEGDHIPAEIGETVKRLESAGQTCMIVRHGARYLGVVGVADTVRTESKGALAALRRIGIGRMILLSGDNQRVARAISADLGIDEARAPLLPDEKVAALREFAREGYVAMVGDGVNDAPALAAASVGIAMGGAGSDVALETADVVLMGDDLSRLPFAVSLARQAASIVRQNLVVSLGVSAILVIASIFGWVRISEAVVLHEGSTLLVAANGLRLLGFRG